MSPAKRFLLILLVVSLVGWLLGNVLFGPPGFTDEYMAQYKADHERYIKIIKSDPYKLYAERPHLHGPGTEGAPASLEADVAFVAEYTSRPDYVRETHRQEWYSLFFDFFNAGLVVALALYFGRKPLLNYIDSQIEKLRKRIDAANEMRQEAEALTRSVQERMEELPEEEQRIAIETEQRLEKELGELAQANHYSLGLMERELVDRKEQQWLKAQQKVQRELVLDAINALKDRFAQEQPDAFHDALIEDFAEALEQQRP